MKTLPRVTRRQGQARRRRATAGRRDFGDDGAADGAEHREELARKEDGTSGGSDAGGEDDSAPLPPAMGTAGPPARVAPAGTATVNVVVTGLRTVPAGRAGGGADVPPRAALWLNEPFFLI
ncbi:hypothetical protein ABT117_13885 [Streptomyces sp. NPDC002262]|uniref:hypothetical protein n=1 Tax=unclassified Streptomyces TaxID=2593676 RepID=UPI0033199246